MGGVTAPAVLTWPKTRPLRDAPTGTRWTAIIEPGRLALHTDPDQACVLSVTDADELRAFALQLYAAAIEYDQARALPPGRGRAHLKHERRRRVAAGQHPFGELS